MRRGLLHIFLAFARDNSPTIRRFIWKRWYQYLSSLDKGKNITFMNYGYAYASPRGKKLKLESVDENNRYCIQLYHHIASAVSLSGLDVLEVGCGRGGGSSYIMRYLKPRSVTGIDSSKKAIKFCKEHYSARGLSFYEADAESLPFDNEKFDVVLNLESSHCYSHVEVFFKEVSRVLKRSGFFLFADYRDRGKISYLRKQLSNSGFELEKEEAINQNVLKALEMDNERKMKLIEQKAPKILHKTFMQFSGVKGSKIYESLRKGDKEYLSFVLRKKFE